MAAVSYARWPHSCDFTLDPPRLNTIRVFLLRWIVLGSVRLLSAGLIAVSVAIGGLNRPGSTGIAWVRLTADCEARNRRYPCSNQGVTSWPAWGREVSTFPWAYWRLPLMAAGMQRWPQAHPPQRPRGIRPVQPRAAAGRDPVQRCPAAEPSSRCREGSPAERRGPERKGESSTHGAGDGAHLVQRNTKGGHALMTQGKAA